MNWLRYSVRDMAPQSKAWWRRSQNICLSSLSFRQTISLHDPSNQWRLLVGIILNLEIGATPDVHTKALHRSYTCFCGFHIKSAATEWWPFLDLCADTRDPVTHGVRTKSWTPNDCFLPICIELYDRVCKAVGRIIEYWLGLNDINSTWRAQILWRLKNEFSQKI